MTTRTSPRLRLPAKLAYTTLGLVAAGAVACGNGGGGGGADAQSDTSMDCTNATGCEVISVDSGVTCPAFVCTGECPAGCAPLVV